MRPAMWAVALLALLVLAGRLVLGSAMARGWVEQRLEAALSEVLDRPVEIGALDFSLLPLGLRLDEVTIADPLPGEPPFATAAQVIVEADLLRGLERPRLRLQEVRLEEPVFRLRFAADGSHNLPRPARRREAGERGDAPIELAIDSLVIERGVLELEEGRLPLDLAARGVQARLAGGREELQGRLIAERLVLERPGAEPLEATVGLRCAVGTGGLRFQGGRLSAPDLAATVSGHFTWREQRELTIEIDAAAGTELLRRQGVLPPGIDGDFRFLGGFAWRPEAWGFRGDLSVPVLTVFDRRLEAVEGPVAGDRNGVRIDIAEASYARGRLAGGMLLDAQADPKTFEIDLELLGVDLERLLADQSIPLSGLAGRVSGVFDYRFPLGDARLGRGWADLKIRPDPSPRQGALPVRGSAPLLIEKGVLSTRAARLLTDAQRVVASGRYELERRTGEFDLEVDSERIEELLSLLPLAADGEPPPLWLPTGGRGEAEGRLTVGPQGTRTRMQLALEEVVAPGARAERVTGMLAVGPSGIEELWLELLQPDAGLIVTGSFPFTGGAAEVPFALSVDAAGWPVAEARPWLPFAVPFEGPVSGELTLGGSLDSPVGELHAEVRPVDWAGVEGDALRLDLRFDAERVVVERALLAAPAGEVEVTGTLDRGQEQLDLTLGSSGLALAAAPLDGLLPGPLTGDLILGGRLTGPLAGPRLEARVAGQGLALEGRLLGKRGEAMTRIGWENGWLDLDGTLLGLVAVSGGGRLDAEGLALELAVSSERLEDVVGAVVEAPVPDFSGAFEGGLVLEGGFGDAEPWRTELTLARLETEYQGHRLINLEPVVVRLVPEAIEIGSLFAAEADGSSELFVAGTVGLDAERALDLRLQSSLESSWVDLVLPQLGLRTGTFDLLATVGGTLAEPRLNGQGELRDGQLIFPGLPHSLREVRGAVLFYPDLIVVDGVRGEVAGGSLLASGDLRLFAPEGPTYRLQLSGKKLNLRYPENWQLRGDVEVVVASTEEGRQVRGAIDLDRAYYLEDVRLGLSQLVQNLLAKRRQEVDSTDELLVTTRLDLAIRGRDALRVRNNVADLRGDLDLLLRGSLARPVVFGRVDLEAGGKLVYGGNEYLVERGSLVFANPLRIEPVIDLVAATEIREYDVTLNLSGTLERLNANFASEPPLADLEVLSLITTGESGGALAGDDAVAAGSIGAEGLLYGQASSLISQRVNRLFGLDRFRIAPLTGSSGNLSSARLTVGKRLGRDLFATYSYDPSTTEQQILQLDWRISRGLTLVLIQNGDETYSVDARWERSF